MLAGSVLFTFLPCLFLSPDTGKWPEDFMSLSGVKGVLFPVFYTAGPSTPIFRFKSHLLWTQGQKFISSIDLMQVKFRIILLRCIARRHVSRKKNHIRTSDILTRHICSCTWICNCPDTLLMVTTQTWFPSRFGNYQGWISNQSKHMALIHS